jgi:hypothetical protein
MFFKLDLVFFLYKIKISLIKSFFFFSHFYLLYFIIHLEHVMEKHKWIAFLATSPFILKANSALRNVLWAIIGILRQEFAKDV